MNTSRRYTGSLPELAGVLAAAVLCGIGLLAHAQSTTPSPPREATPAPAAPPTAAPIAIDGNGKPLVEPEQPKVLADPDTRLYSRCTTGGEHEPPDGNDARYKRPPKAVVITEDEAKARGYRAGAHKASCK